MAPGRTNDMKKSNRRMLGLLRDEGGTAFIEFGILASIFITLTFAIIDFGLMMWLNNTVEHVAAEGARYAAVRGAGKASPVSESQVTTYVQDRATGIPAADMNISVTWAPNNNPGGSVTVVVTYNYEYIIGGMLGFDAVDLQGRSTMIVN
jgi:Flp pilus assembly protein TadG